MDSPKVSMVELWTIVENSGNKIWRINKMGFPEIRSIEVKNMYIKQTDLAKHYCVDVSNS